MIYVTGRSGPFKSTDGGQTWRGLNPIDQFSIAEGGRIAVDPDDERHVVMSSAHLGITFESLDGGDTWRITTDYRDELFALAPGNRFGQGMQALAFAPSWRLKVYGGFGSQACVLFPSANACGMETIVGALTSEDGGRTWKRQTGTGFDTSSVPAIAVHPQNRDVAWAGTLGKGVFKTTDGGNHWTAASIGLTDMYIESLAVDPVRPDILYAGTSAKGIFKSRDSGGGWTAVNTGIRTDQQINALVVNPVQPDLVYAGSLQAGVYASTNAGGSWSQINTGLRARSIRTLEISADGRVLYAGTFGEGVFRLGDVAALKRSR